LKKRKGRELPDLRPKAIKFPEPPDANEKVPEPPSAERIEALGRKHKYPDDFDLVNPIQSAWEWWRGRVQAGQDEPAAIRRRFLRTMSRRAEALEECLAKAGSTERKAIFDSVGSHNVNFSSLQQNLRMLRLGAKAGAKNLQPTQPGPRKEENTLRLLCKLFELNVRAFGQDAPRISNNLNEYSGQFFDFANDVLELFGIRKSNAALGKQIEKAIKIVDKTLSHQSP